ncbi:MAG: UDP-N-acetylglucosamine 1-carboxyvinyltransferase [Candidatus Levybacteria bacterium]|nr:UDP-N-acetylglucosamine 1-carboxyvinyltransferase [Candidatus Levybacteria bacterium]
MEKFIIKGGQKLKGVTSVSGSKNMALKALVAACLTEEKVVIKNIPLISDFMIMADIIEEFGGKVNISGHTATVEVKEIRNIDMSLDKAAAVRTSAMFMAPFLARNKRALIPNPGGCRIGARPIDRIIDGLTKMGIHANYNSRDGYFHLEVKGKINGASYRFSKNTHTGTETLILTSVLSEGQTVLENAAQEPEVDDLINLLNSMGAKVKRVKPRTILIEGVGNLHGTTFEVPADRNEIVTLAIAAVLTKGDLLIRNINSRGISEVLKVFDKCGGGFKEEKEGIRFYNKGSISPTEIETSFYPGFMTDWQGPWAVFMTQAGGISTIHETIYESRFGYVDELRKMGAKIEFFNPKVKNPEKFYNFNYGDNRPEHKHAIKIEGAIRFHNAVVDISDLRAGATLVLAALIAYGETVIFGVEHLDRGYEQFEERLNKLGAKIIREKEV